MTFVHEIMSTKLVTVDPSVTLMAAARAMSTGRVGSVLVLREGSLLGILTERDILRAFAHHTKADAVRVSSVSDWMTPDPTAIGSGASVGEALDRMLSGGFRHLPVVDGGTVTGVVSMRDLARSIARG